MKASREPPSDPRLSAMASVLVRANKGPESDGEWFHELYQSTIRLPKSDLNRIDVFIKQKESVP